MRKQWVVYFMQWDMPDGNGPVKVGCTQSLYGRRRALQVASPYLVIIRGKISSIGTLTAHWMERAIHEELDCAHLRGEWFQDCPLVWKTYEWFEEHGLATARAAIATQRGYPVDQVDPFNLINRIPNEPIIESVDRI